MIQTNTVTLPRRQPPALRGVSWPTLVARAVVQARLERERAFQTIVIERIDVSMGDRGMVPQFEHSAADYNLNVRELAARSKVHRAG